MQPIKSELQVRIVAKDKTVPKNWSRVITKSAKFVAFGANDDYPELMELLIQNSPTASRAVEALVSFLVGDGFEQQGINEIVVGKDEKGKAITVGKLLEQAANSVARNNGYYIAASPKVGGGVLEVTAAKPLPFKNMRLAKPDDNGFSGYAYEKFRNYKDKEKAKVYGIFTTDIPSVDRLAKKGIGELCFFEFFDNEYFYPLSTFDSVVYAMDTEAQVDCYQNTQVRDGFMKRTTFGIPDQGSDEAQSAVEQSIIDGFGPDAQPVITYKITRSQDGNIDPASQMVIGQIDTTVEADLFNNWEDGIARKIRGAAKGLPKVLIDLDAFGGLGNSGESVKQLFELYNQFTQKVRVRLGASLGEFLTNHENPTLRANANWKIKPLSLVTTNTQTV